MMAYHLTTLLLTGNVIQRAGTSHPAMAPTRVFETPDGSTSDDRRCEDQQYEIF